MVNLAKLKKTGKKKFFSVSVPLTTTKVDLYGYAAEEFANQVVKIDMTRNLRGKSLEMKARVNLQDNKLEAEIFSLALMQSFIRRMIRRGTDYIEDSFEIQCKDAKLRVKPFMITRKHVSRAVRHNIRETAKKFLESHMTVRTTREIMSEVMTNKIQKELSLKVKKIYPLGLCEIRMLEVVAEPKVPKSE